MTRVALGNPLGTPRIGLGSPLGVGRVGIVGFSSAAKVLSRATAYWKASRTAGSQYLRDLTGQGHDARFGSAGSARVMGSIAGKPGYLRLPGVNGNGATVPDEAALDTTGNIDLRAAVALDLWVPAANQALIAKYDGSTGTGSSYLFLVQSTGLLHFAFRDTTDTYRGHTSTVAPSVGNGELLLVRATLNFAASEVTFYTKASTPTAAHADLNDDAGWAQLGAVVALAGGTSIQASTRAVGIGADDNSSHFVTKGRVFAAAIFDGINGTKVLDVDFTSQADGATSFAAETGQTVTINSTSGADTNDPLRLVHAGEQYVYLPGVNGNYPSTPDHASLDITGDLDLRVKVAMDDWTPAAASHLIAKWADSPATDAYRMYLNTNGTLTLNGRTASLTITGTSSVAVGAADGTAKWVRATLDVDNGAGGHDIKFWTSDDGVAWTQLGATVTGAGTVAIQAGSQPLAVGLRSDGTSSPAAGAFYRAQVRDGIGGTVVADFDAADLTSPFASVVDSIGKTWTLNRSATGRKLTVVDRTMLLFGTDDYAEVADHPDLDVGPGEVLTAVLLMRRHGSPSGTQAYIGKRDGNKRWRIIGTSLAAQVDIGDGVVANGDTGPNATSGVLHTYALRLTATQVEALLDAVTNGATARTAGDLVGAVALVIGREGTGSYADMSFVAAAIFKGEALSDADLAKVAAELKAA